MTPTPVGADEAALAPLWRRLHRALMPDYNRKATVYWWVVVSLGVAAVLGSALSLAGQPAQVVAQVAVGVIAAMLAGIFPVRVRHSKNSYAAGEIFIFLLLLMHGPAAASVAAAGEAAVGSFRTSKRWTSRIISPAIAALAMWGTGVLLQATQGALAARGLDNAGIVVIVAMAFAMGYFVAITLMLTAVPRLKRNEPPQLSDLFGIFGWVGIAYAASAAVAALLYLVYRQTGIGVLMGMLPLLAMLLATLHYFFRQQESAEAARRAGAEAAEREAVLAARHMRELEASERRFHHLAFHDSLTGLPNRRRFNELLSAAVADSQSPAATDFAVMFLDFDRFKLINDGLGHDAGDAFLVQVAQRIQDSLRPGDVVARLGGDEFAVLVQRLSAETQVVALAERLMEILKRPFHVAGTELITSASIGITFSRFGYTAPEHVLRDADTAMYKAKGAGKARYALFDTSLHTEVANRLRLEGDLRHAIAAGQLALAYQPIHELAGARLVGFEALVRWKHPLDGAIAPGTFLPIAEEAGMMLRISDFVLNCACHQLRLWQDELDRQVRADQAPQAPPLTMSVNISGHDLAHPAFVARISRALIESGLQARQLTLELTENILMSRLEGALSALSELRRLGVGLAVDDFGTGYSSLSHLATLPIDTLKIDRSFVARLAEGSKEAAVVRAIVLLGSSLGKSVLAEGIETESQLSQLRAMGCALGQGFLLAPPLTPAQVQERLRTGNGASWRQPAHEPSPSPEPATTMVH